MKDIEITITPDGELKIETSGYIGVECLKALDAYLKFMKEHGVDADIKDQKKKPAFYQVAAGSSIQVGSQ